MPSTNIAHASMPPYEQHVSDALARLLSQAVRARADLAYAGDISPAEVFEFLKSNPAVVVDVRTLPEWQFTGVSDLSQTQGRLATISWKIYPQFAPNPQFPIQLAAEEGVTPETPLFFMCRSGGRSLDAALAMTAQGYRYCFNIAGGFEGEPDTNGHRGLSQGWKAAQLPWKQG